MRALFLLPLLLLTSCSGPKAIVLRDPETRQVVECKADPWATWEWDQASYNEDCAKKYERAGFVRLE